MSNPTADADYFRRRKIAEETLERDGVMPDFLTGVARVGMYEQLVNERMPPPASDAPFTYQAPAREQDPTPAQVALAVGQPDRDRGAVERMTAMQEAIGAEMAAADRVRRGEPEPEDG